MTYHIVQGERVEHGIAMAQVVFRDGPTWADIWVDCAGACEPQQSIGLRFDDRGERIMFSDHQAAAIFVEHGWTYRDRYQSWRCPVCAPGREGPVDAA